MEFLSKASQRDKEKEQKDQDEDRDRTTISPLPSPYLTETATNTTYTISNNNNNNNPSSANDSDTSNTKNNNSDHNHSHCDHNHGGERGGEEEEEIILPGDIIPISSDDKNIYSIGTHGKKINSLNETWLTKYNANEVEEIVFRSHLIMQMNGFQNIGNTLTCLELYDNSIEALNQLEFLPNLTILDISYNVIRDMSSVRHCPNLVKLYIAQNKLTNMEGLDGLSKLEVLDLGANRLRKIENIQGLTSLRELWCGKNKISTLPADFSLMVPTLRRLDIQSNRLVLIEDEFKHFSQLEELYLASNGLDSFQYEQEQEEGEGKIKKSWLEGLNQLNTLDLSHNRITSLEGVEVIPQIEEFWLSYNKVGEYKLAELELTQQGETNKEIDPATTTLSSTTSTIMPTSSKTTTTNTIENPNPTTTSQQSLLKTDSQGGDGGKSKFNSHIILGGAVSSGVGSQTIQNQHHNPKLHYTNEEWRNILAPLSQATNINCVYLDHNPIYTTFEYRKKLRELLSPSLCQIDATMI